MPQLLVFVPCEKVIIDENQNPTLVVLMQGLGAAPLPGQPAEIPRNAVGPKEWCIFSVWRPSDQDYGKLFNQRIQLLWPDGSEFQNAHFAFQFEKGKSHQIRMNMFGFPIGQVGDVTLNMWLERDSKKIGEMHSRTITVKREET